MNICSIVSKEHKVSALNQTLGSVKNMVFFFFPSVTVIPGDVL